MSAHWNSEQRPPSGKHVQSLCLTSADRLGIHGRSVPCKDRGEDLVCLSGPRMISVMIRLSSIAVATALTLGGSLFVGAPSVAARDISSTTVTTTQTVYMPGSPQSVAIYAWIRAQSPEYAPMLDGGQITVVTEARSDGNAVAQSPGSSPPVGLPSTGQPGEVITIMQNRPNGDSESWTYTYSNSGVKGGAYRWVLSAYDYKKGNLRVQ